MKFKIYLPASPKVDVNTAALPWVYDQDRSSGYVASMWVRPAEEPRRVCKTCGGTGVVKGLHNWATGGKREEECWNCSPEETHDFFKGETK